MQQAVKLIELEDTWTNTSHEYPYVQSARGPLRFRLRSELTLDHDPFLIIDNQTSFESLLPRVDPLQLDDPHTKQSFLLVAGKLTADGAWEADLPSLPPGVVSFQVCFVPVGSRTATNFGSHDVIILTQDKVQLRAVRNLTVFPRCIGPVEKWGQFFTRQMALGYNAFHLAPIQETGYSNSYYSLKSHLELSSKIFKGTQVERHIQLESVLGEARKGKAIFFVDIILNHTSFDSEWVRDAPDSVFTVQNTPSLLTAFIVDRQIFYWGHEVKETGLTNEDLTTQTFDQIREGLLKRIKSLQLAEYFLLDPELEKKLLKAVPPSRPSENIFAKDPIQAIQQFIERESVKLGHSKRGVSIRDLDAWKKLNLAYQPEDLQIAFETYNQLWRKRVEEQWIPEIVSNTINKIKHEYFDNNYRQLHDPWPLVNQSFTQVISSSGKEFWALNNGWLDNVDATEVFAVSKKFYYLRRLVNTWGDLLRIRYGQRPEDSPTAWSYMLEYVLDMAKYFDGFRLDNLHGTQLSVARYMIKEARKVNPQLIVYAQLFTSCDQQTAVFVREIGINSLIQETINILSGPQIVRQFHRKVSKSKPYLGSLGKTFQENGETFEYSVKKRPVTLVCDLTHDNQTYISKKIQILQTPVSFTLSLLGTFTGSTKGYDQFYTRRIDVTQLGAIYQKDICLPPQIDRSEIQRRLIVYKGKNDCDLFGSWDGWRNPNPMKYNLQSDMYWATLQLPPGKYEYKLKSEKGWILDQGKTVNANGNHEIVVQGGSQRFLYQNLQELRRHTAVLSQKFLAYDQYYVYNIANLVVLVRQPEDHLTSICVISNFSTKQQALRSGIKLPGHITKAHVWLQTDLQLDQGLTTNSEVINSQNYRQFFDLFNENDGYQTLRAATVPPGFACLFQCSKSQNHKEAIQAVRELIHREIPLPSLSSLDLNSLLYGIAREEETIWGQSNYVVPQSGDKQLVYAGFGGVYQLIKRAKRQNGLSEGLFENLRQGDWLLTYYLGRVKRHLHLQDVHEFLERLFFLISQLPPYLRPKFFADFLYNFFITLEKQVSPSARTDFERHLRLIVPQFVNRFPKAPTGFQVTLSAGLPYFAVDWARSWGRDTFTCNQLLLTDPSLYKQSLLQYGSALRHGLIPNLLDFGVRPRYNSRDACWWWIRGVGEYANHTGDFQILKYKVDMLFLSNDALEHNKLKAPGVRRVLALQDVVQQIFQSHVNGISFREWNAGYQIDSNMTTDGFNIDLIVDPDTGFILGGNPDNCLTWMDKMGSSYHAGTKGVPSTPRAGAPVQLVGLLYNCLKTFQKLYKQGHYTYEGVHTSSQVVKFEEWSNKIAQNFDPWFYLIQKVEESVHIGGIYKDLVYSPIGFDEERFRPNALITLALAPQICQPQHARSYIQKVEQNLIKKNSIGVGTLAETHSIYCSYYDNADNSSDGKVSQGFSYHNGPEWVFLYGFYLVAKINFSPKIPSRHRFLSLLQNHIRYIQKDEWFSLPEITNKNGQFNFFSCSSQAWSISSIIFAMNAINSLPEE